LAKIQRSLPLASCANEAYEAQEEGIYCIEARGHVYEYKYKFSQLSRYAPNDVEEDHNKPDFSKAWMMVCNINCFLIVLQISSY